MKRAIASALALLMAGGGVYYSYRQSNHTPETPEGVIWRMLELSRGGDVEGYLDCFTGATRARLEITVREMTAARFADYLMENGSRIKGVAVYDIRLSAEGFAGLVVEYVYQDQNEKQRMSLKLQDRRWRIDAVEASQRIQPLIPYGKPVTEIQ